MVLHMFAAIWNVCIFVILLCL